MKLQPGSEMQKVTESNFEKLKADVLASNDFKNLVKGIESQAENGIREYTYYHNTNRQIVSIFQEVLIENGYKAGRHLSGLGLNIEW